MKKSMEKRTKRGDSPWGGDGFEERKTKGSKSSKTAKRFRVQDLSFDDEY